MATEIKKPLPPAARIPAPKPADAKAKSTADAKDAKPEAKADTPKADAPKADAPKTDAPKPEAPAAKTDEPANAAPAQPEAPKKPNQFFGFFDGFVKEGVDTAVGLYNLVTTNPITTAKGLFFMASHPKQAVSAIVEPYTTAYKEGRYGEMAGRIGFQALSMVLTSGALSKGGKGAEVGTKVPTEAMTTASQKVVDDLVASSAKKSATQIIEKQMADGSVSFINNSAKNAAIRKLTAERASVYAEKYAARGIGDKIAQGIATSGLTDDAVTKIMSASGGKVAADQVYRYASQAMKAGLSADEIATNVGKFSTMSAKRASSEVALATKLMQQQAGSAAVLAQAAAPKAANTVMEKIASYEKLIGKTSDETLKAGYQAQLDALKAAAAKNPLADSIAAGKRVGFAERNLAVIGQNMDHAAENLGKAGQNVAEGAKVVKGALDHPNTIGGYAEAVSAVPRRIGAGLDAAAQKAGEAAQKALSHLPDFSNISIPNIANVKVPSPWQIISSPVTVPTAAVKYAVTNPARTLGILAETGNAVNIGRKGAELKANQPVPEPVSPAPVPTTDPEQPPTSTTEPTVPAGPADPAQPGATRDYALQPGDTLETIAERELGDKARWTEIYELNKKLFDTLGADGVISAGTKIKLPVAPQAPADPAADAAVADRYKSDVLALLERFAAHSNGDAKTMFLELRKQLSAMPAADVYKLKTTLEAQGLVLPPGGLAQPTQPTQPTTPPATGTRPPVPGTKPPATGTRPPAAPTQPRPTQPTPAAPKPVYPVYTVQRGDTLTGIADQQLKDWRRYHEIVDLNNSRYPSLSKNPDFILTGWQLQLPTDAKK